MNDFIKVGEIVHACIAFDKIESGQYYGTDVKGRAIILVGTKAAKLKNGYVLSPSYVHVPIDLVFATRRQAFVFSLTQQGNFPVALKYVGGVIPGISGGVCPNYRRLPDGVQKNALVEFEGDWIDSSEFLVSDFEIKMRAKNLETDSATLEYQTFEYGKTASKQVNGFRFEGCIEFDYILN